MLFIFSLSDVARIASTPRHDSNARIHDTVHCIPSPHRAQNTDRIPFPVHCALIPTRVYPPLTVWGSPGTATTVRDAGLKERGYTRTRNRSRRTSRVNGRPRRDRIASSRRNRGGSTNNRNNITNNFARHSTEQPVPLGRSEESCACGFLRGQSDGERRGEEEEKITTHLEKGACWGLGEEKPYGNAEGGRDFKQLRKRIGGNRGVVCV